MDLANRVSFHDGLVPVLGRKSAKKCQKMVCSVRKMMHGESCPRSERLLEMILYANYDMFRNCVEMHLNPFEFAPNET